MIIFLNPRGQPPWLFPFKFSFVSYVFLLLVLDCNVGAHHELIQSIHRLLDSPPKIIHKKRYFGA